MKTDRHLLLAAVAAALAVTMLTAVSSASAAVWKHEGVNITKPVKFKVTGEELFETGAGGMVCEIHATVVTEGGSVGEVTWFTATGCTGFGDLTGCSVMATQAMGLPWVVDVNTSTLTITKWRVLRAFDAGCAVSELDKTISSVFVLPDVPAAISELEIIGKTGSYSMIGLLGVAAPNAGTYGIG
jgi:hypothetical protein